MFARWLCGMPASKWRAYCFANWYLVETTFEKYALTRGRMVVFQSRLKGKSSPSLSLLFSVHFIYCTWSRQIITTLKIKTSYQLSANWQLQGNLLLRLQHLPLLLLLLLLLLWHDRYKVQAVESVDGGRYTRRDFCHSKLATIAAAAILLSCHQPRWGLTLASVALLGWG